MKSSFYLFASVVSLLAIPPAWSQGPNGVADGAPSLVPSYCPFSREDFGFDMIAPNPSNRKIYLKATVRSEASKPHCEPHGTIRACFGRVGKECDPDTQNWDIVLPPGKDVAVDLNQTVLNEGDYFSQRGFNILTVRQTPNNIVIPRPDCEYVIQIKDSSGRPVEGSAPFSWASDGGLSIWQIQLSDKLPECVR